MHRPLMLVALAGSMTFSAPGAPPDRLEDSLQNEEQRVLAVEDQWIDAEVKRDEATLRRVIDDRFVYNSSSGKTSGKEALITSVLGANMVSQNVSERTVLVDGETAMIFGTTELRFASADGEATVSHLRYTAVYVKRHDQWRALALQMAEREAE